MTANAMSANRMTTNRITANFMTASCMTATGMIVKIIASLLSIIQINSPKSVVIASAPAAY